MAAATAGSSQRARDFFHLQLYDESMVLVLLAKKVLPLEGGWLLFSQWEHNFWADSVRRNLEDVFICTVVFPNLQREWHCVLGQIGAILGIVLEVYAPMQCNCRVYSCLHLQQGCWLQKETSYHPLCLCQILLHVQCKVLDPSNESCIRDCQISAGIFMDSAIFSVIAQRKIRCHHLRLLLRRLFHFGIWIRKLLFHNRFDSRMDIHFLS